MRIIKLVDAMHDLKAQAALLTKRETIYYFSGFDGEDTFAVVTPDARILITDSRFAEQAKLQAPDFHIEITNTAVARTAEILAQYGFVLVEEESLTYQVASVIDAKVQLIPASKQISFIRAIKEEQEIQTMKKAQAITDATYTHMLSVIREGVTELELVAELEYFMKKQGATLAFPTILAVGANSSMPHAIPGLTKTRAGEAVLMDFGARVDGYCSDMTRTVFLGHVSPEMKKIYEIVLDAQLRALDGIAAGMECPEAHHIAHRAITEAGYGAYFQHGLGHGIGLECHESPRLSPRGEGNLLANMAVTVEPGIYLEGKGGVRIEDMCIIREGTLEVLTRSNKNLTII